MAHVPKKANKAKNPTEGKQSKTISKKLPRSLLDLTETVRKAARYLMSVKEAELKNCYFDTKTSTTIQSLAVVKATEMARREIKSMVGTAGLKITLPHTFSTQIQSAVTSGIVNATRVVDGSLAAEFAACAALFDEFRYQHYFATLVGDIVGYGAGDQGNALLVTNSNFLIAYDPADALALTSVIDGCGMKQHHLLVQYAGSGVYTRNKIPTFKFFAESEGGTVNNTAGAATILAPRQWQAVNVAAVTILPVGYFKWYWVITNAVVTNVFAPIVYYHLEFRSRQ
jgi:hypothetical protein